MNKQIKFSEEWDKLRKENRIVGKEFTTARGYEPRKQAYYERSVGDTFDVMLKGEKIGEAKLDDVLWGWATTKGLDFWRADTYKDNKWYNIFSLLRKFYQISDPFMIFLYFKWTKVETE